MLDLDWGFLQTGTEATADCVHLYSLRAGIDIGGRERATQLSNSAQIKGKNFGIKKSNWMRT